MRDPSKRSEEEDSDEVDDHEDDLDDDGSDDEKDEEDQEGFMSMLQNFLMSKLDLGGNVEAEKVSQCSHCLIPIPIQHLPHTAQPSTVGYFQL